MKLNFTFSHSRLGDKVRSKRVVQAQKLLDTNFTFTVAVERPATSVAVEVWMVLCTTLAGETFGLDPNFLRGCILLEITICSCLEFGCLVLVLYNIFKQFFKQLISLYTCTHILFTRTVNVSLLQQPSE